MLPIPARGESIAILERSGIDERALEGIAEQLRRTGATVTRVRGRAWGPQLRAHLDELRPDLVGVHGTQDEHGILALRRSIPDACVLVRLADDSALADRYVDARVEVAAFPAFVAQTRSVWRASTEPGPPVRVVDLGDSDEPAPDEPAPADADPADADPADADPADADPADADPADTGPADADPADADPADVATTAVVDAYFGGTLPSLPAAWTLDGVQLDREHRCVQLMLGHPQLGLAVELSPRDPETRAYVTTRDLSLAYRRPRQPLPSLELRALLDALIAGLRRAEAADPTPLPARLFSAPPASAGAPALVGRRRPPLVCIQPWVQMEIVDPSGLVYQCCSEWTVGHRGAFPRRSLQALWNGPEYRAARRAMVEDVGSLCRSICPRLEDRKFAEEHFRVESGAARFVRNQLLLAQDIALAREEVQARPIQLALCPSTYCNYDCVMCTYGRTPRRDLPEEIWAEVTELLPTLRTLGLLGGEPLANASAMSFLRRWNRDEYPDARVDIVTNGALLTERALAHLERCRFGSLTISLNAGTPEVYEQVQRGLQLETVLENIDAIRQFRRTVDDDIRLTLSFVAMPQNIATLQAFGELAHARDLAIRLLPLTLGGVGELDFYDDPDAVADVLGHVQRFRAWVEKVRPAWLPEVRGLEAAIRGEADSRRQRHLPIVTG